MAWWFQRIPKSEPADLTEPGEKIMRGKRKKGDEVEDVTPAAVVVASPAHTPRIATATAATTTATATATATAAATATGEGRFMNSTHPSAWHHGNGSGSATDGDGGGSDCGRGNSDSGQRRGRCRRREVDRVDIKVPVMFKQRLSPAVHASLLAELLRHVLFARGQIPMPYQQLLQILEEREARDRAAKEERALRLVDGTNGPQDGRKTTRAEAGARGVATGGRGGRGKARRDLARATAHRRARKAMATLAETTDCIAEAFTHASVSGRRVREALILMGASHLSPREIYSVTFADSGGASSSFQDGVRGGLADACSRKLVRSLIGGTSGVTLPRLGACRVHIFLRLSDEPHPTHHADENDSDAGKPGERIPPFHAPPRQFSTIIPHLSPRPGFKVRTSRTRPSPKISIVIGAGSPHGGIDGGQQSAGSAGGHETVAGVGELSVNRGAVVEESVGGAGGVEEDRVLYGRWHQLVSARLAGLKGCDALAS